MSVSAFHHIIQVFNVITDYDCINGIFRCYFFREYVGVFFLFQGDSGGPMTCYSENTPYLAGATSWGISTCSGDFPSVYARLTSFRSWISSYVSI